MLLKNKKKLSIILAVVIALSGIIGYRIYANIAANKARAGKMAQTKAVAVQVAQVSRRDISPTVDFSANLEPLWSADISSKVDGRINTLTVNEGDIVQGNAVIATLDTNDLQAQVIQAQGNLMAAQSNLEQAELDYNRYAALASQGAVSQQMLDNARTRRDAAAGQVRAVQGALSLVQEKYNNANIIVPREGIVTKRYLQAGTFTKAGSPIITIADTSTLLAKATIGESQISGLSLGSPVIVKVDALNNQQFNGTITRISPAATLPSRTFTAEISIPNQQSLLRAGMFARVQIPIQVHSGVLAVPESALVLREDQKTVFVVGTDNKVQQKVLTLGYVGNGWAEVLAGINDGDTIVIAGQNKIRDGVEVAPTEDGGQ